MTPLEAIEAGTATAAETLGPKAPKKGRIEVGFDADLVATDENPLEDIWVLSRPEHVTHVWKVGELVKEPGRLVCISGVIE